MKTTSNLRWTACLLLASIVSTASFAKEGDPPVAMNELWGDKAKSHGGDITDSKKWFSNDKYALFIHWGLYSQAAGQWKGNNHYGIAEWLMHPAMADISVEDYEHLAKSFNPRDFDATAWVDFAKRSGVRTIVITAKHHDGFAMFKSRVDKFNIVDATPFRRDPLKELANACAKAGIRFGFYYSQFQDWRAQGGAEIAWDDPKQNRSFDEYFQRKALPQVQELLTNYGPISVVWFDTPGTMGKAQSEELVRLVRRLQPNALINSRVGNGMGDYSTLGDNEVPRVHHDGLWEAIDTTNNTWGHTVTDTSWKSAKELGRRLVSTVARGGSYMINMGPTADGSFSSIPKDEMLKLGQWLGANRESVYGAGRSPWSSAQSWGDVTSGKGRLYLHVFEWPKGPDRRISLYGIKSKVGSARMLVGGTPLPVSVDNGWVTITLPEAAPGGLFPVVELEIPELGQVDDITALQTGFDTTLIAERANCDGCTVKDISWMEHFGEWKSSPSATDWTRGGGAAWDLAVRDHGRYRVAIDFSVGDAGDFSEWELVVGDQILPFEANYTGERSGVNRTTRRAFWGSVDPRFRHQIVGTLELAAGQHKLIVRPKAADGRTKDMKVAGINLVSLDSVGW